MDSQESSTVEQTTLTVKLFGEFRVWVDGSEVQVAAWKRRSATTVVKLLALAPSHRVPRDQLMELLWPDLEPGQAMNNLYQALHAARQALGADAVMLRDQLVQFGPHISLKVDVQDFEEAIREARAQANPSAYRRALGLYRDNPLADDPYESWAIEKREELQELLARAALALADVDDGADDYAALVSALRTTISNDPFNEIAHRALISTLARIGQRNQALRHYEALQQLLAEELGIEPETETQELVSQIRSGQFVRPQSEAQLPRVAGPSRTNLPESVNRFIGREREGAEVRRLLGTSRLLTLTGPGGCGKTRLAIEVARTLTTDFPDGVWLIEMASLSDPELIPQEIATAIGIREVAGQSVMHLLASWLRGRKTLLVLDNCEHLIDASARVVEALLRAGAGVRVLATSREPLRIGSESTWIVPSLSLPDPAKQHDLGSLSEYEAVQFFVERARQVAAGFSLTADNAADVAELCFHLDGIPLALELAAARVRAMTARQIVDRLDDRFRLLTDGSRAALSRQQTLQAALDWSYDLLGQQEQVLFGRLSVFSGGFTLDAAESVCSVDLLAPTEILDLLTALVDRSLVIAGNEKGEIRYRLLETMRQYARNRLVEIEEERQVADAHAEYFASLGALGSQEIRGASQRAWLDRLETEHDNVRAALDCFQERDDPDALNQGLLLAGQMHWFWHLKGHFSEGRARLEQMIGASRDQTSPGCATALTGLGDLALAIGDHGTGRTALERSVALWRTFDDPSGLALALIWLGWAELFHGRIPAAQASHREGLALFSELDNRWGIAMANLGLGFDAAESNNLEEANAAYEQAMSIFQEIGDDWGITTTLQQIAHLTYRAGDFTSARERVTELLKIEQRMGDAWLLVTSQGLLSEIARAAGDIETAAAASEACIQIATEIGHSSLRAWGLRDAGFVALARGNPQQAENLFFESLTIFREPEYPLGIVCCLVGLAGVAAADGDYETAAFLLGAVEAELGRRRMTLAPADRLAGERIAATVVAMAGATGLTRSRGKETSLSEAIARAERR